MFDRYRPRFKTNVEIEYMPHSGYRHTKLLIRRLWMDGKKKERECWFYDMANATRDRWMRLLDAMGTEVGNDGEVSFYVLRNWSLEYEQYLDRHFAYAPVGEEPFVFDRFVVAQKNWDKHYVKAWKDEDFDTIARLEKELCV